MQEYSRDERTDFGNAVKSLFAKTDSQWSKSTSQELNTLSRQTNAKRGDKAVDEYLKKYGQRKFV